MNKKYLYVGILILLTFTASVVTGQVSHSQHGSHSSLASEKSFQAKMSVPDEIKQKQLFTIKILIQDEKGRNVEHFDIFQEKLMHLIMVSDNFEFFRHLHPYYKGNGVFLTEAMLPDAGAYTLFCDYKPANSAEQLSVLKLRLKGTKKSPVVPDTKKNEKIIEDVKVGISFSPKRVKANEETIIVFNLKQVSDGSPVKELQPFLGEKGHLVVIRKSEVLAANDYIHAHAMKEGKMSEIKFMTKFPRAGIYKLWCQFNHKNKVSTADFWINIE